MPKIDKQKLFSGDLKNLAKAITLTESTLEEDIQEARNLVKECIKKGNNSVRIGISGVPGVGKSTFIETFGLMLVNSGHKVAVLAVDPSSSVSGGSILGDKTRMEELSRHPNAFIRPSPSSGHLGGVGAKTREALNIVEAAGFDVILIETVGVGQSEYAVKNMVDFFLLLLLPGGGDEVQGIKKGIIEIADLLVINKADGKSQKLAELTANQYETALSILNNPAKVLTCSALKKKGIEGIWQHISETIIEREESGDFEHTRSKQSIHWMNEYLQFLIKNQITNSNELLESVAQKVRKNEISPQDAALQIFSNLKS